MKKLKTNQIIPTNIVKYLNAFDHNEYESVVEAFMESYNDWTLPNELDDFCKDINNLDLCILYLLDTEMSLHMFEERNQRFKMKTSTEGLATLAFFVFLYIMNIIMGFEDTVLLGLAVTIVKVLKYRDR